MLREKWRVVRHTGTSGRTHASGRAGGGERVRPPGDERVWWYKEMFGVERRTGLVSCKDEGGVEEHGVVGGATRLQR